MALKLRKNLVVLFQGDSSEKENKYIKLLEKENIQAMVVPTLAFNFINKEKLRECIENSDCYSGIIFTSSRAVSAVSSSFIAPNNSCIELWKKKKNFCVGKATADYAFSSLNLETFGSDSGNSENLCHLLINMCGHLEKPFLFPCSSIRKDTIPKMLSEKGIPIKELVCYETIPNKDFENSWRNLVSEQGLPEILIFFSPSGVQSCIKIIQHTYADLVLPKFIAIGPSTEKALSDAGILCKVSEKPTPESIMCIITDLIY